MVALAIHYLDFNSKRYPCYTDNKAKKSIKRMKGYEQMVASSLILLVMTAVGNTTNATHA